MSISIHSETSKDDIETEDAELEDLVWNLMSRTGLLHEIQGQISKFIESNGKGDNVTIQPERVDGRLLGIIFEYLQWVGMKQTSSVLLSESPVEVDVSLYESRVNTTDYKPELCKIFEDQNGTEDKASPTRSHNYSKDEFEDSRLTSASGHHSIRSDNSVEDNAISNDNESKANKSSSSHSHEKRNKNIMSPEKKSEKEVPVEQSKITPTVSPAVAHDVTDRDMISFYSPAVSACARGFDQIRPNVTARHRLDLNAPDPFQSPVGVSKTASTNNMLGAVPTVDKNNRLSFVQASNSLEEILGEHKEIGTGTDVHEADDEDEGPSIKSSSERKTDKTKAKVTGHNVSQQESSKPSEKKEVTGGIKDASHTASQDEEESTSDFMETLTMEDDTQDASIDSNARGMSSCEHAVNLK